MLVIRKAQMQELEAAAVERFVARVLPHFQRFFPRHFELLGEARMREIIRAGVDSAERHGFTTEREACLYISLQLMLGVEFDTDPQLPWAAQILADQDIGDSFARAERLYDTALDYLGRVAGPDGEHIARVLETVRGVSFRTLLSLHSGNLERDLLASFRRIHAEKFAAVGPEPLRRLIGLGTESARHYGIEDERLRAVYIGFMYLLGSGFVHDPRFPFAQEIVEDPALQEQAKVESLFDRGMEELGKWMS